MDRFKTLFMLVIVVLLLFIGAFLFGRYNGKLSSKQEQALNVSSQLILDRITSQYFLVTKTVYMDSKAEIETPKRDDWVDFIKGTKITVSGLIRVDIGVDMKGLNLKDVTIDTDKKIIRIKLPSANILDSSLYGELKVEEEKAILDKLQGLFKDTQNEDYNRALETLIMEATTQVSADRSIFDEAKADSIKLVELIVGGVLENYQVIVE